jgi:REP element-mobilizing transposase RayT
MAVVAYCLMTNHVHLVVIPRTAQSLAGALKPVHLGYAQHVNWTRGLTGRLWQGRFFSCGLDDAHLLSAVRYVERNPVRAGPPRNQHSEHDRIRRAGQVGGWTEGSHLSTCRTRLHAVMEGQGL